MPGIPQSTVVLGMVALVVARTAGAVILVVRAVYHELTGELWIIDWMNNRRL